MQNMGHVFFSLSEKKTVVLLHIQLCMPHDIKRVITANKCFITIAECSQAHCGQA